MKSRRPLGVGVIGSGRIGTLRATLASRHAGVGFLAVSDVDAARAEKLAQATDADLHTTDNNAVIQHPQVDLVVVSTVENAHTEPALAALAAGKPVLIEKPLALTLPDCDRIVSAAQSAGVDARVGYSRRFKKRYLLAKEQLRRGRLGAMSGATVRLYNIRAQALVSGKRLPENSLVSGLQYYIDLIGWLFAGNPVVEVVARGKRGVLEQAGVATADLAHAILTLADGAVVGVAVSYALPRAYPALGHSARVELLGADGVMLLDDDHTDQILYSDRGVGHVYLPGHEVNMAFMGSGTPGDWALDEFWGPVATEMRAWLDHHTLGRPCLLATVAEARRTLAVAQAMERSLESGQPVRLD